MTLSVEHPDGMQESNKLGYAFSICRSYYSSIDSLIDDIESNGIDKRNVLFVSSQEAESETLFYRGCEVRKVTYSGLHLTQAIFLSENHRDYEGTRHWFLLPSTVRMGAGFHSEVTSMLRSVDFDFECFPVLNPKVSPTMDMAVVSLDHIKAFGEFLQKIKLSHFNDEDLVELKRNLILSENLFLGINHPMEVQCKSNTKAILPDGVAPPSNFMINSIDEVEVEYRKYKRKKLKQSHFKPINLTKYQRTHRGLKRIVMDCDGGFPDP